MNRIFRIALLGVFSAVSLISCNHKDDAIAEVPPVPFAEQYPVDLANIDKFLDEYHMDVSLDNDATFSKIPTPNPTNIQTIRQQYITPFPAADRIKTVTSGGIDYKIYFIPFNQGGGQQPSRVDSVYVAYKGQFLYKKTNQTVTPSVTTMETTEFDQAQNPAWFPLTGVVQGWKEIIPLFKTAASHTTNGDGSSSFNNYGAGVMFLPSAFGYYNAQVSIIPMYSPLIFSFKLMSLNYVDNDFDRIDSKDEDVNGNGILTDDDTDGDGHPNYLDQDDDGDGYFTKYEISHKVGGVLYYYPFNGALVDDPNTAVDERQGIPRRFTGPLVDPNQPESATNVRTSLPSDFTDPARLRINLDRNNHTATGY